MIYNSCFKLISQTCFLLFLACCVFFQSIFFMKAIAFALLICTAYWIYVLITPPKGKRLSIIILLGIDIIALLKIIFSNDEPPCFGSKNITPDETVITKMGNDTVKIQAKQLLRNHTRRTTSTAFTHYRRPVWLYNNKSNLPKHKFMSWEVAYWCIFLIAIIQILEALQSCPSECPLHA